MRCPPVPDIANDNAVFGNEPEFDERTPLLKAEISAVRPVRSQNSCWSASDEESCNEGSRDEAGCEGEESRKIAGIIMILLIGQFSFCCWTGFGFLESSFR